MSSETESPAASEMPAAEPAGALSDASPQSIEDNPITPTSEVEDLENNADKPPEDLSEEISIEGGAVADASQNPAADPA